ncbi:hypothetical protein B0J14DRAFT_562501 [Halenospora varia]|nr:hypothetical protein B0J14DRAFT_562501 [Halenospora varia]
MFIRIYHHHDPLHYRTANPPTTPFHPTPPPVSAPQTTAPSPAPTHSLTSPAPPPHPPFPPTPSTTPLIPSPTPPPPQRRPQPRLRILSQLSSELDEESRTIPVNAWVHIAQLLEGVVLEGKLGMRTFRLGSEEVPAVVASSHNHHLSGGEDKEELKKRDSDGVAGGELSKPVEAREPPKPVSEKETESEIAEATMFAREERECVFRAAQEVEIKRQMEGWMDLKAPKGEAKLRVWRRMEWEFETRRTFLEYLLGNLGGGRGL